MKPSSSDSDHHPQLAALNARSGLILFFIYLAIYGTFVGLAAFFPETMAQSTRLGPNVAILYGFGLILGAFLLALVYMLLCSRNARYVRDEEGTP